MKTQLLKQLPSKWEEVTLRQFNKLTTTDITDNGDEFDGIQNVISIIAILTDSTVDEIESLPMKDLQELGSRLNFITTQATPSKTTRFKWKRLSDVTYNDYVSFIQLQDKQLENLHVFIKNFSTTELSEEDILELPITECLAGFFLFKKQVQLSVKSLILSTKARIAKLKMIAKLKELKKKIKL